MKIPQGIKNLFSRSEPTRQAQKGQIRNMAVQVRYSDSSTSSIARISSDSLRSSESKRSGSESSLASRASTSSSMSTSVKEKIQNVFNRIGGSRSSLGSSAPPSPLTTPASTPPGTLRGGDGQELKNLMHALREKSDPISSEEQGKVKELLNRIDLAKPGNEEAKNALKDFALVKPDAAIALFSQLDRTSSPKVAKFLMQKLGSHAALYIVKGALKKEIEKTESEGTLFRGESFAIDAAKELQKNHFQETLQSRLGDRLREIPSAPVKGKTAGGSDEIVDPDGFEKLCDRMLDGAEETSKNAPPAMKELYKFLKEEVNKKFPDVKGAGEKHVASLFFLRLMNPATAAPKGYGMDIAYSPPQQSNAIMAGKIMQNLANETVPGNKETYMSKMDNYTASNSGRRQQVINNLLE